MQGFEIYVEQVPATTGVATYVLKLYQFDGTPKPLMYQVYNPPQMLPTTQLHEKVRRCEAAVWLRCAERAGS